MRDAKVGERTGQIRFESRNEALLREVQPEQSEIG
jgi:hypothetical protein